MEIRGPRIWSGRPVGDDEAGTILNTVLGSGIPFIDTANDYGRSEEFIGRFLAWGQHRRDACAASGDRLHWRSAQSPR